MENGRRELESRALKAERELQALETSQRESEDKAQAGSPSTPLAATDVVGIMQESIRGGQIKEFTFNQIIGWDAGDEETVNDVVFQTGRVSYNADIFGIKTIEAKALIKKGKVQRWIWPKSGLEIQ